MQTGRSSTPADPQARLAAPGAAPVSPVREVVAGLSYVWRTPWLHAGMWLAFLVNLTAFPISGGLLPYIARNVYGLDQTGLGYLAASFASGALVGSLLITTNGSRLLPGRTMLIASGLWYATLLAFAQTGSALIGAACLFAAGCAQSFSMVPLAIMLLRTSEPRYRARVMGVRMLAIYSLPIGLLVAGILIERIGFHTSMTLYAIFGLVATALIAVLWRRDVWQPNAPGNKL
jgi:predicted MFS family arabinose efflux permease